MSEASSVEEESKHGSRLNISHAEDESRLRNRHSRYNVLVDDNDEDDDDRREVPATPKYEEQPESSFASDQEGKRLLK